MPATPSPSPPPPLLPVEGISNGPTPGEVLDFISSLVASLAWPVAVFVLLLFFRGAIIKLVESLKDRMPSIERVKTPWLEAAWTTSAVEEVASEVGATPISEQVLELGAVDDVAVQLAKVKPSAGVIEAFTDLERQIFRYLSLMDRGTRGSPVAMFSRDPGVPERLKNVVRELSQLRNAAAHGRGDISEPSALAYISTVRRVTDELRELVDETERGLIP